MLCLATLTMIALSWPLWLDGGEFPRVPFVGWWPEVPGWVSRPTLGAISIGLVLASIGPAWRVALSAALVLVGVEVIGDQSRLQPWVYQFELIGLALVLAPGPVALRLARIYAISLYAYSGLSKLDPSFASELGPVFLGSALRPFGIAPEGWPGPIRVAAVLAMPAWEIAVAAGLVFGRSRRVALLGAIAQHAALLAILGPWGLRHSAIVLIWNAAMIAEDVLLFGPRGGSSPGSGPASLSARVAVAIFGIAVGWPSIERLGLCDSWPGHALYASHAERAEVSIHEEDADRLPPGARERLGPADFEGWRRLDLTAWSRAARGVPAYPQARVGLGVAEALSATPGLTRPVRVVLWGRASLRDGGRERAECVGLAAMRRREGRFAINARPSPGQAAARGRPGGP